MTPVFIAHRGYAAAFPENTLVAIEAAREAGARYIEVDVLMSADHVPVLFHDRDMQRLCEQPGAVHDYTFEQLRDFSAAEKNRFGNAFESNRITRLDELVNYIQQHEELHFFIELKRQMIDKFGVQAVEQHVVTELNNIKNNITIISYDQEIVELISERYGFSVAVVVDHWHEFNLEERIINKAWLPEWYFCWVEGLPENQKALDIEPRLAVFEVADVATAKELMDKGINYLETFRIKEMHDYFEVKQEQN